MKQSKLRRRRVWRYSILYFVLLIVFLALLVGPIVASVQILSAFGGITKGLPSFLNGIVQNPNGSNNDTGARDTDTTASPSATNARMVKLF
jgi:1,3-beta-glucan synthase